MATPAHHYRPPILCCPPPPMSHTIFTPVTPFPYSLTLDTHYCMWHHTHYSILPIVTSTPCSLAPHTLAPAYCMYCTSSLPVPSPLPHLLLSGSCICIPVPYLHLNIINSSLQYPTQISPRPFHLFFGIPSSLSFLNLHVAHSMQGHHIFHCSKVAVKFSSLMILLTTKFMAYMVICILFIN
jgi:hypothetical protein